MSTYTGKDAIVEAGSTPTTVGKVKSLSYNGSVEVLTDKYLGEAGEDNAVGSQSWEGSITYHHDPDDNGQAELVLGALVDVTVYPQGMGTGNEQVDFTCIITQDPTTLEPSTKVEKQVSFRINGVPVKTTQS